MTVVYAKKIPPVDAFSLRLSRKLHSQEARALLAYAAKIEYGVDVSRYPERRVNGGKPCLVGAPFFYNLSHSGDYVVCALSDSEVGVDIEKIVPISLKVMRRFFGKSILSPREQMRLWTRYESYGKMTGTGIPYPIGSERPCYYREYTEIDRYYVTACSEKEEFAEHLIIVDDVNRMLSAGKKSVQ